ncbi:DUF6090 family protein, partial [Lutimonas sp.]|uniref:DUF6090 family protein n=1 Tax=Lutimonas sp. TaxID=1872403 RepID=UPI003D9BA187
MIPFFRKIRKKMADDNRPLKYMRYAVGEIVLVVVGILIALQINTWNEERKDRIRGISHLKEIRAELLFDSYQLDTVLKYLEVADKAGLYMNDFLLNRLEKIDSTKLKDAYLRLGHLSVFNNTKISYNNLLSSGEINLIQNDTIKRLLGFMHNEGNWDKSYHDGPMQEIYNEYSNYINKYTEPLMVRHFFKNEFKANFKEEFKTTTISVNGFYVNWEELKKDSKYLVLLDQVLSN